MRTRSAEVLLWGLGLLLIAISGSAHLHGQVEKRSEMKRFAEARAIRLSVDTSLWSEGRLEAFEASLLDEFDRALATLRIPAIEVDVPVLRGTDKATLNRAVGWIEGTSEPGEPGNVGLAGHRDGFFRGLKDIAVGDTIEFATLDRTETYVITETMIVDPDAVGVLDPTEEPTITLVTCFPFYYVGPAPQRFIVRAVRLDATVGPAVAHQ